MTGQSSNKYTAICRILLLIYLAALIYLTIFAGGMGRIPGEDAGNPSGYNLELFNEIKRFITYREQLGMRVVALNIIGNIAAFIPAGILLPLSVRRLDSLLPAAAGGFFLSLAIECTQYLLRVGSFDVDDLLLNTFGTLAGYFACRWFRRIC